VYLFINIKVNIKPFVETLSPESRKAWATTQPQKRRMRLGANASMS
jgi:hypothetical protein